MWKQVWLGAILAGIVGLSCARAEAPAGTEPVRGVQDVGKELFLTPRVVLTSKELKGEVVRALGAALQQQLQADGLPIKAEAIGTAEIPGTADIMVMDAGTEQTTKAQLVELPPPAGELDGAGLAKAVLPRVRAAVQRWRRAQIANMKSETEFGAVTFAEPADNPKDYNNPGHPATTPVSRPKRPEWMERHEKYAAQAAKGDLDIIIVGDSLTQGWETRGKGAWEKYFGARRAAPMGINNDGTQQVLWRIDHGTLDGSAPRVVVVLIGVNNLGNENTSPAQIRAGVAAVIQRVRMTVPAAKILLLGLFPLADKENVYGPQIAGVNVELAKLADGKVVHFLDIGPKFLIDGKVHPDHQPDGVHLSEKGYAIYGEAVTPKIDELLAK